jgi:hypothetical protein
LQIDPYGRANSLLMLVSQLQSHLVKLAQNIKSKGVTINSADGRLEWRQLTMTYPMTLSYPQE